jgi:hypothetical protein
MILSQQCQGWQALPRHLEIRPLVSGLECCPAWHPFASLRAGSERSEGSGSRDGEILSAAKDDRQVIMVTIYKTDEAIQRGQIMREKA